MAITENPRIEWRASLQEALDGAGEELPVLLDFFSPT